MSYHRHHQESKKKKESFSLSLSSSSSSLLLPEDERISASPPNTAAAAAPTATVETTDLATVFQSLSFVFFVGCAFFLVVEEVFLVAGATRRRRSSSSSASALIGGGRRRSGGGFGALFLLLLPIPRLLDGGVIPLELVVDPRPGLPRRLAPGLESLLDGAPRLERTLAHFHVRPAIVQQRWCFLVRRLGFWLLPGKFKMVLVVVRSVPGGGLLLLLLLQPPNLRFQFRRPGALEFRRGLQLAAIAQHDRPRSPPRPGERGARAPRVRGGAGGEDPVLLAASRKKILPTSPALPCCRLERYQYSPPPSHPASDARAPPGWARRRD